MVEDLNKYNDLIRLLEAAPQTPAPDGFSEGVMMKLAALQKNDFLTLFRQALSDSAELSWSSFKTEFGADRRLSFYFLVSGLFFFIISSILFSSIFLMPQITKAVFSTFISATFVLMASLSLAIAGLMMAVDMPDAQYWANRALLVHGGLILVAVLLIQNTVSTVPVSIMKWLVDSSGVMSGLVVVEVLEIPGKNRFSI